MRDYCFCGQEELEWPTSPQYAQSGGGREFVRVAILRTGLAMSRSLAYFSETSWFLAEQAPASREGSSNLSCWSFSAIAQLSSSSCQQSFYRFSSAVSPTSSFGLKQVKAVASGSASSTTAPKQYEEYEVELEKPIGLKFYRGADGGVYIDAIAPGGNADKTKLFTPGDRVIATSAVFGNEMWPSAEYGRTMYTIRQRIGTLALKMERRFGEREDAAVSRDVVAAERNAGVIGDAVREIQIKNYLRKMELKKQREEDLEAGLKLYKQGKYREALEKFDLVLGAKPEFKEEAIANYNVACCYSMLNEVDAGLSVLESALEAGFEDYKMVRTDPDLANLRASPAFKPLIDRFDEPFINENAVNALKNIFGFFGKK